MNSNMPPSKDVGLARCAVRCSREFPKCAACRPWPGECVYHRLGPVSMSDETVTTAEPAKKETTILPQNSSNVDQRLSRVEKALDTLSDVTNTSLVGSAGNRRASEAPSSTTRSDAEAATSYRTPIGECAQLADILFITPPDDLLLNVIFDPATVPQRAWIVYVNFILLTLLQNHNSQSDVVESLQKNTEMALNDCRIFLEPSEINVQALLLLGCHGGQYASPNLSWMLVGHACRQAQALGLHVVGRGSYKYQQRQLSLFWSLFSIDKSCSLAFGRPMLLLTTIYQNVPLPDFPYLLGYHPHRSQPIVTQNGSSTSTFGAHFFIQGMKSARLTGAALSLLASPGNIADHQALAAKLRSWDSYTNQLLLKVFNEESATSTAHQIQEMTIGVRAMRFQYLHILILVLRKDPSSRERRVQAARDAIMLLPYLVSNSIHVYNGLVWQPLYYPFTPFFTLFGHIMDYPSVPSTPQDLELLQTTATYFNSMKQFGSLPTVSPKLEKTALVFCNLANFITSGEHTGEDAQDQQSTVTGTSSEESVMPATSSEELTVCGIDTSSSEADFELYTNAFMAYIRD
ncbi:hypothetical protein V8C34DRAFT_325373 [Trichoderma compactum]